MHACSQLLTVSFSFGEDGVGKSDGIGDTVA